MFLTCFRSYGGSWGEKGKRAFFSLHQKFSGLRNLTFWVYGAGKVLKSQFRSWKSIFWTCQLRIRAGALCHQFLLLNPSALRPLKPICSLGECRNSRTKALQRSCTRLRRPHLLMVVTFDCTSDACDTVPSWCNQFSDLQWEKPRRRQHCCRSFPVIRHRTIFVVSRRRLPNRETLGIRALKSTCIA